MADVLLINVLCPAGGQVVRDVTEHRRIKIKAYIIPFDIKGCYLQLCKVTDRPFHIQGDDSISRYIVNGQWLMMIYNRTFIFILHRLHHHAWHWPRSHKSRPISLSCRHWSRCRCCECSRAWRVWYNYPHSLHLIGRISFTYHPLLINEYVFE